MPLDRYLSLTNIGCAEFTVRESSTKLGPIQINLVW